MPSKEAMLASLKRYIAPDDVSLDHKFALRLVADRIIEDLAAAEGKPKLTAPTIHMNGTSRESLAKGYEDAALALQKAMKALDETFPNGRDFYVQGPDAILAATREHRSRVDRLQAVYDELYELRKAIEPDN